MLISSSASEELRTKPSLEHLAFLTPATPSKRDHSLLSSVTFDCKGRARGYYADRDLECIVFHYCDEYSERYSYKCKDEKKFDEITNTCTYHLEYDCVSRIRLWDNNSNPVVEEIAVAEESHKDKTKKAKLIFSPNDYKRETDHRTTPDEGLRVLSAFASLTQNSDHEKYESDSKFSGSDKIERVFHLESPALGESGKQRQLDYNSSGSFYENFHDSFYRDNSRPGQTIHSQLDAQPSNDVRVFDDFHSFSDSLEKSASHLPFTSTAFSYNHPTALGRNNFDYYPSVTENYNNLKLNYFSTQNSRFGSPSSGKTLQSPAQSHFSFITPSSQSSLHHPNVKKTLHDKVEFHGSLHPEPDFSISSPLIQRNPSNTFFYQNSGPTLLPTQKLPSLFSLPTPRSIPTSTSVSNIFGSKLTSGNQEAHAIYTDEPFKHPLNAYPQYNKPLLYEHPLGYPDPLHSVSYPFYDDHYSLDAYPESPGFSQFPHNTGIQSPGVSFRHDVSQPLHINSPGKSSQKTVKFTKTSNTRPSSGQSQAVHTDKQSELFVNKDPVIYVTASPKHVGTLNLHQKEKKHLEKTEHYLLKDVDEELEDYTSDVLEDTSGGRTKPQNKENHLKSIKDELEVTTYSPILSTLKESPVEDISNPRRTLRRKNQRLKSRPPARRENFPKQETEDHYSKEPTGFPASIKNDKHLKDHELPLIAKVTTEAASTTAHKPTAKPSRSSVLRGSLKDRLNRLATRRQFLNQEKLRAGNKSKAPTSLISHNDQKNTDLPEKPTFQPETKTNEEAESDEAMNPTTSRRLKDRESNLYKGTTQSRRPQRPLRKRLNQNDETIIKKEDAEDKKLESLERKGPKTDEAETAKEESDSSQLRKGTRRRRPLNPEVRARFKEFLKTRNSRLNRNNKLQEVELTETQETPEPEASLTGTDHNETTDGTEETSEATDKIDSLANESEKMEKSIPLVREEKVVLLLDPFQNPSEIRQKRLSDAAGASRPDLNLEKRQILSHSSAKPFRYMLKSKEKEKSGYDVISPSAKAKETPSKSLAERILELKTRRPKNEIAPDISKNNGILENDKKELSVLPFTVVRPSNFKQIVKMHPQTPSAVSSTSTIIPTTITKDTKIVVPPLHENEVYSLEVPSSTRQDKKDASEDDKLEEFQTNSEQSKTAELDNSESVSDDNDESISINGSKPVFNLDSVAESISSNSQTSHISALESNGYRTKISSVNFEPFTLLSEEPLLPIQRLLQIK